VHFLVRHVDGLDVIFRVDARRVRACVAEQILQLADVHAISPEHGRARVAEHVWRDFLVSRKTESQF